ncbi:MAG: hypothetical protein ACR2OQ_01775 [Paracoccaceae bacterium]
MNNQRNDELKNLTMKMLARLNAPRAVAGNTEAMKQEAEFLCNSVIKLGPSRGYVDWFAEFELEVFNNLETRTWPTAKEINKSAKTIAPRRPEFNLLVHPMGQEKYEPDPYKINAARIKNHQPVCEKYVQGSHAEKMIRKGLVTEDDLQPYQESLTYLKEV